MLFLYKLAQLVPLPGDAGHHCSLMEGGRWKVKPPLPPFLFFRLLHIEKLYRGSGCWEVSEPSVTSSRQEMCRRTNFSYHNVPMTWGCPHS